MLFGQDFFKIIEFITAALRLFARIFGDEDDRRNDDIAQGNHTHEKAKIIKTTPSAKTKPKIVS